jgi:hypothetical protein
MKMLVLTGAIIGAILLFSQCMNAGDHDPRGKAYAGSAACISCHKQIVDSYKNTPHYHSAAIADLTTIEGSFSKDANTFVVNDTVKVVMEDRPDGQYQVLYVNGKPARAERFDIVFGHSKGQTYLYWKKDLIAQLPISWFTGMQRWTKSPGYPPGMPFFDRPVLERCFECHTSFITQSNPKDVNALDKKSMILNIDCERCHGPAAKHVAFQTEAPDEKQARFIVSCKSLTRRQRMDMCAICHAGTNNIQLRSTFDFRPGDSASRFAFALHPVSNRPDVHGDQASLLASSKCFRMSEMDCNTCHNVHLNDHDDYAGIARRCQGCHTTASHNFCKLADSVDAGFLKANCTKCHMPAQASDIIKFKTTEANPNTAIFMINHRIAVYPDESKKILTNVAAPAYSAPQKGYTPAPSASSAKPSPTTPRTTR